MNRVFGREILCGPVKEGWSSYILQFSDSGKKMPGELPCFSRGCFECGAWMSEKQISQRFSRDVQ